VPETAKLAFSADSCAKELRRNGRPPALEKRTGPVDFPLGGNGISLGNREYFPLPSAIPARITES
jgi:hypothetical protein